MMISIQYDIRNFEDTCCDLRGAYLASTIVYTPHAEYRGAVMHNCVFTFQIDSECLEDAIVVNSYDPSSSADVVIEFNTKSLFTEYRAQPMSVDTFGRLLNTYVHNIVPPLQKFLKIQSVDGGPMYAHHMCYYGYAFGRLELDSPDPNLKSVEQNASDELEKLYPIIMQSETYEYRYFGELSYFLRQLSVGFGTHECLFKSNSCKYVHLDWSHLKSSTLDVYAKAARMLSRIKRLALLDGSRTSRRQLRQEYHRIEYLCKVLRFESCLFLQSYNLNMLLKRYGDIISFESCTFVESVDLAHVNNDKFLNEVRTPRFGQHNHVVSRHLNNTALEQSLPLQTCIVKDFSFRGISVDDAYMSSSYFYNVDFSRFKKHSNDQARIGMVTQKVYFENASFRYAQLNGVFNECFFKNVDFSYATLINCSFVNCSFVNCSFISVNVVYRYCDFGSVQNNYLFMLTRTRHSEVPKSLRLENVVLYDLALDESCAQSLFAVNKWEYQSWASDAVDITQEVQRIEDVQDFSVSNLMIQEKLMSRMSVDVFKVDSSNPPAENSFRLPNSALKVIDREDLLSLQHSSYQSPYEQSTLSDQALDFEESELITVKRNRRRYRKNELDTER